MRVSRSVVLIRSNRVTPGLVASAMRVLYTIWSMAGYKRTPEEIIKSHNDLSDRHSRRVHSNPWNIKWPWIVRSERTELARATNDVIPVLKKQQMIGRFLSVSGGEAKGTTLREIEDAETRDEKLQREGGGGLEGY